MPLRDLAGHRHVLTLLSRAVRRGSLPPSLIFAGPDGVGKRQVALALAQALNCPSPVLASDVDAGGGTGLPLDACGRCGSCRRIERGVHPDVTRLSPGPTGSIKVDQVRETIERTAYRPFEGRMRVVIVEPADALVQEAQNALLKTLEEPPTASAFVLVTAVPDALLPTVRSRCPRVRFGRLSHDDVSRLLVERHGYDAEEARAAAAASEGSIGAALAMSSAETRAARDAAMRALAGVAQARAPRGRLDAAAALAGKRGSSAASDRDQLALRLRSLESLLRDLEILSTRADARWLANADLRPGLTALAESYDARRTHRAFSAVGRAGQALERNASARVVADWLAFEL